MTMIVFLLSQFVCHLLYFLIFPVPVIFKKIVLHAGVRGRYLCPQPKFQNPGWPVIWYSGSFEGGQLCDTKSPFWEERMPWNKTSAGIYLS